MSPESSSDSREIEDLRFFVSSERPKLRYLLNSERGGIFSTQSIQSLR